LFFAPLFYFYYIEGLSREKIKQKYGLKEGQIKLVERYDRLIEEYDLDDYLKNVMKIEEWSLLSPSFFPF